MKIYSLSQFNGELDILELKLETLDSIVDYFVISESTMTHSSVSKPLFYKENESRFKKFQHKIIYQVVSNTPQVYQDLLDMKPINDLHAKVIQNVKDAHWLNKDYDMAFIRDDYEKEVTMMGLIDADKDDIVIFGDLDEIPRPETLQKVIDNFDKDEVYLLQNEMFYLFFNLQKISETWFGPNVLSFDKLLNSSFGKLRQFKEGNRIDNGGWHFTYMGGADMVKRKIESYSHQEFNNPEVKGLIQFRIDNCIGTGQDILGRPSSFTLRDINDGTFPEYLVNNQSKFKKYLLK